MNQLELIKQQNESKERRCCKTFDSFSVEQWDCVLSIYTLGSSFISSLFPLLLIRWIYASSIIYTIFRFTINNAANKISVCQHLMNRSSHVSACVKIAKRDATHKSESRVRDYFYHRVSHHGSFFCDINLRLRGISEHHISLSMKWKLIIRLALMELNWRRETNWSAQLHPGITIVIRSMIMFSMPIRNLITKLYLIDEARWRPRMSTQAQ